MAKRRARVRVHGRFSDGLGPAAVGLFCRRLPPLSPMGPSLQQILTERRDEVVARFVTEVQRKDLPPPGLPRPVLIDHIPRFLDEIVEELMALDGVRYSYDVIDQSPTARRHGGQRWTLGYDLDGLVREYGILRHAIMETAKAARAELTIDDFDILAKCLNVGVAEAAAEYGRYRDRQLAAQKEEIEFLAKAGQLLSSSLDYASTLARLTGLIVPRLADWCAVNIEGQSAEEFALAHLNPAKAEVLREILVRFPPAPQDRYGYPEVVRTGKSQLVEEAPPGLHDSIARSPEHLALLREIRSRSWIVVPLRIQSTTFGAITLAWSESPRRYGPADLLLVEELARRAAVAIDNAHLYETSQKERARVEATTRAKDEFVAMVSHELRTPLNAILGWTGLLKSGSLSEATRARALDVIHRNAVAQNQIVADLLDISRVITGTVRINPSQVDLANIVDLVVEGMRPAIDAKRLRLAIDVDPAGAVLRGDGDRLQQVVWNLLSNAVKFTRKEGTVQIHLRRIDSDVELTVSDDGEGIPRGFLPHVFETFRQSDTPSSRPHSGLGIGLSIAKHLVELHGGTIRALSEGTDRGATFVVTLPISPVVSTTVGITKIPATRPPSPVAPLPDDLGGIVVLVVDDDADARELLEFMLERSGMEVRVAASSAEALDALRGDFNPSVIVSDIGMPDGDGYSLIRDVRTHPQEEKRGIPAIALTAFARTEDRTRALVEGFNVHMAKPVEPLELIAAVARLAGGRRRTGRS
jgi:signal transduction histidine kinase/CheY-like chemotaxis protein